MRSGSEMADNPNEGSSKLQKHGRLRRVTFAFLGALLLVAVVVAFLITGASSAAVVQAQSNVLPLALAGSDSITPTIYLPLVGKCFPSAPSPFAIQIAALDQIEEQLDGRGVVRPMTEAEWLDIYAEPFLTLTHALEKSGAAWARVLINWSWIQPDEPPADYVWGPYHDEKLRLVAETGVQLIATIAQAPDWAAWGGDPLWAEDPSCAPIDPTRLDEFGQFVTEVVNRYKQAPYNIRHWELFNEPDGTTADRAAIGQGCGGYYGDMYAQMLAVAYPAIKAADPGATVLMGGLAHDNFTEHGHSFNRYFPDDVMAAGGGDYTDALVLHYFNDFAPEWERWVSDGNPPTCGIVDDGLGASYTAWGIDLVAKINHYRNRLNTCYGVEKPIWVTELAAHGFPGDDVSLTQQARYVVQGYARSLAAGAENITWFALVSPDNQAQGLLYKDDWSPKPAYYAYQTMAAELTDYRYAYTRGVTDPRDEGVEAYVFEGPCGVERTVAWYRDLGGPENSGLLNIYGVNRVRVVDRHGTETFIDDGSPGDYDASQNGAIRLLISSEPVFISAD